MTKVTMFKKKIEKQEKSISELFFLKSDTALFTCAQTLIQIHRYLRPDSREEHCEHRQ